MGAGYRPVMRPASQAGRSQSIQIPHQDAIAGLNDKSKAGLRFASIMFCIAKESVAAQDAGIIAAIAVEVTQHGQIARLAEADRPFRSAAVVGDVAREDAVLEKTEIVAAVAIQIA